MTITPSKDDDDSTLEKKNQDSSREHIIINPSIHSTNPGQQQQQQEAVQQDQKGNNTRSTESSFPSSSCDNNKKWSVRSMIGQSMISCSNVINENLVTFRYGVVATVAVLTVYGIANTPLFYRFKTVADIPAQYFSRRRRIRGRIIRVIENENATVAVEGQPIVCMVRHLSPVGLLLSKSWFEFFMKSRPSVSSLFSSSASSTLSSPGRRLSPEERPDELMQIEIAGIETPSPYYSSKHEKPVEFLHRLAKERTLVSVELLARRLIKEKKETSKSNSSITSSKHHHLDVLPPSKRDITAVLPELDRSKLDGTNNTSHSVPLKDFSIEDDEPILDEFAIARLYYRPKLLQWFATDIAQALVKYGQVNVSSDGGLYKPTKQGESSKRVVAVSEIVDTTCRMEDIHKDAIYMSRLGQIEYEAAKLGHGMWMDPIVRANRQDILDEVDFQTTAPMWKKLWRKWFRGG